jgi:hypothetical protein
VPRPFSERLFHRQEHWWGRPRLREVPHRWRESRARRSRDDPDEVWRCCDRWQRTVANKYNGREFAARHGVDVPELYWSGGPVQRAPLHSLPASYVIRPEWGGGKRGVVVVADGEEVLRGPPLRGRVLVGECLRTEDGRPGLPLEFKCYVFGGRLAAIRRVRRAAAKEGLARYYSRDWEPFADPMDHNLPQDPETHDAPPDLAVLVAAAERIGAALGTFMRVDFFLTDRGWVHNEFGAFPNQGLLFTPYAEEYLGRQWEELIPEAT